MSYGIGEETEGLESSFSKLSVTSPSSQLILQPFRRFTYVKAHSPNLPLLHLRHSSFSNPSFSCPTSKTLHLRHLANRPCTLHYVSKFSNAKFLSKNDNVLICDEYIPFSVYLILYSKQCSQESHLCCFQFLQVLLSKHTRFAHKNKVMRWM